MRYNRDFAVFVFCLSNTEGGPIGTARNAMEGQANSAPGVLRPYSVFLPLAETLWGQALFITKKAPYLLKSR